MAKRRKVRSSFKRGRKAPAPTAKRSSLKRGGIRR